MPPKDKTKSAKKSSWDRIKHKTYDASNGFGDTEEWKQSFHRRLSATAIKNNTDSQFPTLTGCQTMKELKTEYKKLIRTCHPDIAGDTEENKQKTQQLIKEYDRLKVIL